MDESVSHNLLPHLFRLEYTKLTAVICRQFGFKYIEIAEDIASDTFLKAYETWMINGIPENPTAWLYVVAKNKTKDHFKRLAIFENQVQDIVMSDESVAQEELALDEKTISDSQLAMIFSVCNPANSTEGQICLALQVLCGFSVEEIANAFLTKQETIKKRLLRARASLRTDNFRIEPLNKDEVTSRLDTVLKTLYLLFNEGYFSKNKSQFIREELCSEAIRLTLILAENPDTNLPQTNALLSLMCFQSSRLEARVDKDGAAVLFDEQNKDLWDKALTEKGNYYLVNAFKGGHISKYHLEASIAYWHTTPNDENKWKYILQLYNELILIEYSPVTALNRAFAYAKVYGHDKAIREVEKLSLIDNGFYHGLLGYLYASIDIEIALNHYKQAVALTKSKTDKQVLQRKIERLRFRNDV
ncbi:RNA polymerase sigma factor [Dyadobacter arcticus]|uniref:RNA polymerase sigma-70 factor (ECF subfamily) n=1 Tax=Dyadobacter arcticus TaxID=1078754 RepID=A0ABX0UWC0_9BACT|nr:DUF6596 domain-containing protein [Dyadobacter arcticus]NIJ56130.1 RNA polymerase sigma-70 factor (ECF subfamily) [Dyadobacter arcticus]